MKLKKINKGFWSFTLKATVVAGLIAYFCIFLINNREIAIALTPWATLLLALAAFWAIRQNYSLHKRERKERLLNEIIEWALDISNCKGNPFHTESDKIRDEWSAKIVDTFSLEERFYDLENRGKYIQQIALKLEKGLGSAVGEVMSDIKGRRMQLIDSMGTRPTHDLDMDEMRKIIDIQSGKVETLDGLSEHAKKKLALGKSAGKLRKSVSKLIEEATEIKTRDIS